MRKHPNGFGRALRNTGDAIREAARSVADRLRGSSRGNGRSYAGGRARGRQQMGPTPVLGAPGTPIRSSAASNAHAHGAQQQARATGKVFSGRVKFANKKRFAATMSAVVAAVLVPVIATTAVEGGVFTSHGVSVDTPAVFEPATGADEAGETKPIGAYASGTIIEEPAMVSSRAAKSPNADKQENGGGNDTAAAAVAADDNDNDTAAAAQSDNGNEAAEEATPEPTENPYRPLAPGETNDSVIELQQRLMELHYMENDEPTSYYGPQTQQAVAYFQRKNGLDVDGYAGPDTQDVLFSGEAKVYTVSDGAEGNDVWDIQERLSELGYDVSVTGYYGSETADAVRYFQRMNGITDDGTIGMETKDILFSEHAEPAIPPEPEPEEEPDSETGDGSAESGNGEGTSGGGESAESAGNSGGGESSDKHEQSHSEESPKSEAKEESKHEEETGGDAPAASSGSVEAFVSAACAQEGKPYVLGGKGPNTFDCSGLVYYALKASGNGIGYMTSGGWANSGYPSISWDNLRRGDVVCMKGHVAVYLGDGMMCDASSSNGQIMIRGMGNWARNNFICGKRPL